MSEYTKNDLKARCSNGTFADASLFADIIDSLKGVQAAVSDPSAAGTSITFIATISQDAEGKITATKKTVNFNGYQTVAGMSDYQTVAGMARYQYLDLQQVGDVTAAAGESQTINHKMKHYPTVRLIDDVGVEVSPSEYWVKHADDMTLVITLGGSLDGRYKYILD